MLRSRPSFLRKQEKWDKQSELEKGKEDFVLRGVLTVDPIDWMNRRCNPLREALRFPSCRT